MFHHRYIELERLIDHQRKLIPLTLEMHEPSAAKAKD